jgi:enoyl-CoA hydratase/carnithine racemase
MTDATDLVQLEVRDGIGLLCLNRPAVLNALNAASYLALEARLDELEAREDVRALVLTGQGARAFSAGADLTYMRALDGEARQAFILLTHRVTNRLAYFPRPSIGAIRGYALGGGFELVMACDLRVAGRDAVFGLPEMTLGSIPGSGGVQRLPLLIGPTRAKEVILAGRRVTAEESLAWGLVNQVVDPDQVLPAAQEMARRIAGQNPVAVEYAKRALQLGHLTDWGLPARYHSLTSWVCQQTPSYRANTTRFAEPVKEEGEP